MAIEEDQVRSSDIYKTLSAPLDVQVEVTTLCNEACVHCYNFWRGKQFKKEVANFPQKTLQKDQLSHIMAGLIQDQVFSVTFTGGEPFLYRSTVIEGIRQAREGGLDCSLNSNLTTMTPATADRLRKMGLGSILTSLHSFDEEIHDAITQREGFFKRTVRGIKICQEAGLSVAANMVVTRMNQNQVFETGAFVKKLGVKSFSATKATPCLGGTNFSEIGINRGAFKQMLEDLLRLEKDEGIDVDVETWEIDNILGGYLKNTLDEYVRQGQGKIKAHIHAADFIEGAAFSIQFDCGNRYTHAILNPPYKKICASSKHRKLLRMVGIETVNLYTAFVALTMLLMEKGGEVVAIIPRSFCNGSYYRPFRNLILRISSIRQLHLFESRNLAFQDDDVLQENIIIHLVKGEPQGAVIVSTSHDARFSDYQQTTFDAAVIVKPNDIEQFIHIPTVIGQTSTPKLCTHTLRDIGLEVCTGPVVDFRLKAYWRDKPTDGTVPLLYPHHFSDGALCWPKSHKKPNALQLSSDVSKWLMPRGHYVLVKRFSTKEERRRLVAYHLSYEALDAAYIGFENHWNVFHIGKHGIDEDIAKGLATFLNSTILDEHFRVFSGHTQVNATDLRNMRYPSLEQLRKLGKRAKNQPNDQATLDRLLEELETA